MEPGVPHGEGICPIEHQQIQVDVQIERRAEALDQGDAPVSEPTPARRLTAVDSVRVTTSSTRVGSVMHRCPCAGWAWTAAIPRIARHLRRRRIGRTASWGVGHRPSICQPHSDRQRFLADIRLQQHKTAEGSGPGSWQATRMEPTSRRPWEDRGASPTSRTTPSVDTA